MNLDHNFCIICPIHYLSKSLVKMQLNKFYLSRAIIINIMCHKKTISEIDISRKKNKT